MPYSSLSGLEFRQLRLELHWTQQQLAKYLGVHYRTVGRWELDQCKIPIVYEMTMRYLLKASDALRENPLPEIEQCRPKRRRKVKPK